MVLAGSPCQQHPPWLAGGMHGPFLAPTLPLPTAAMGPAANSQCKRAAFLQLLPEGKTEREAQKQLGIASAGNVSRLATKSAGPANPVGGQRPGRPRWNASARCSSGCCMATMPLLLACLSLAESRRVVRHIAGASGAEPQTHLVCRCWPLSLAASKCHPTHTAAYPSEAVA